MTHVCALTSVHQPFDGRIFHRECKALAQAGCRVTLIAPADFEGQECSGVTVLGVPRPAFRLGRTQVWWWLYRQARRMHPNGVRSAPGVAGFRLIYVTCVSKELAHAARSLGADGERLEVAPWGVDTKVFHPSPQCNALRQELGLDAGPVILSIRAIRPVYNPLDLAQAIPRVLARVPDAQFVVRSHSYDADLLDRFQAVLDDHGVRKDVYFVGDLPNDGAIAELYRLADVAVSVPSSDGTPQSVLEAMACGVPLVLSDGPSLHEWVRDAQEGLFVPIGDTEAISAAIVRLLADDGLRRRLQAAGLHLVQQRVDSRVWMAHAEQMYEQLIRPR